MTRGRVLKIFFWLFLIFVACRFCIVRDTPFDVNKAQNEKTNVQVLEYPVPKNIKFNGVDYLQSQVPVGEFGGELITSIIGEGPKTFNPFNSKDNTVQISFAANMIQI